MKPNFDFGPGQQALHLYFGLSYASWLTLPRVLMCAMPDEWQGKMAELLAEYDAAFVNRPRIGTTVRATEEFSGRLTAMPRWVVQYRHPDREAVRHAFGDDDQEAR